MKISNWKIMKKGFEWENGSTCFELRTSACGCSQCHIHILGTRGNSYLFSRWSEISFGRRWGTIVVFFCGTISGTPLVSLLIISPISSPSGLISRLWPVSLTSLLMVGGSGRRTGHLHPQSLSSTRCQAPLGLVAMMCSFGTRLKMVTFLLSLSYKGC